MHCLDKKRLVMISLIWYAHLYLSSLYLSIYMCIYVINYTYTYLSIHIHMSIVPNLYYFLNFFVIQLSFFLYLCKTSSLISSSFFHILLIYLFTYYLFQDFNYICVKIIDHLLGLGVLNSTQNLKHFKVGFGRFVGLTDSRV